MKGSRKRTWQQALLRRAAQVPPWSLVLVCLLTALGGIAWLHQSWLARFQHMHGLEDTLGETLRHVEQAQGLARERVAAQPAPTPGGW